MASGSRLASGMYPYEDERTNEATESKVYQYAFVEMYSGICSPTLGGTLVKKNVYFCKDYMISAKNFSQSPRSRGGASSKLHLVHYVRKTTHRLLKEELHAIAIEHNFHIHQLYDVTRPPHAVLPDGKLARYPPNLPAHVPPAAVPPRALTPRR
jgi:hypothetical protein